MLMNRLSHPVLQRVDGLRWLPMLGALLIAMLCGVVVSLGVPLLSFALIGGIVAAFMLLLSADHMLYVLAISVTLVIGQLMYFAGINQALWLPYGLGLLLFLQLPGAYEARLRAGEASQPVPFIGWFYLFTLAIVLSVVINLPNPLQVIVGSKNLIALWSVYLIIALGAVRIERVEKLFSWLFPLALLQLPFVLYQYFIVAGGRSNRGGRFGVSWDAIVGSFGGDPNSGGASGVMAFFLAAAILLAFTFMRAGLIRRRMLVAVVAVAAVCIGLAEVKVIVVLLPIGMAVIMLPEMLKRPVMALVSIVLVLAAMLALLYLYDNLHYSTAGYGAKSLGDLLDSAFGYSLDPDYVNLETGELGRVASLVLWWRDGFLPDPIHGLFGYGPGASRSVSNFAVGEVAAKYPFYIDRSAACQLLWDIGLCGFLAMTLFLLSAAMNAYRLAKKANIAIRTKACLQFSAAILALEILMLPYGRDLLEVPAQSCIMFIIAGYVALVSTKENSANLDCQTGGD